MGITRLDWDSSFMGLHIGRVDVVSVEEGLALANQESSIKNDFDLIYVFANHGLDVSLPNARLVDEKVVYTLSPPFSSESNRDVILWDRTKGVTDDLLQLALVSGKYSRFKLDEGFPTGSYERLYSRWIEQSVNHVLASEVFCYMEDEIPRGLVTLSNKKNATIGLVAIHEDFQHRGIGRAMINHVANYVQKNHCEKLSVITQLSNVPACRLYEKSGFAIESITDVWHWWL